jgi:hypothetical protein
MPVFFALTFLLSLTSFAKLQNLTVVDGNFSYVKPFGNGDVQKIQLGISKSDVVGPYPISITREANALTLKTEYVDFSWLDPMDFFHDMEKLYMEKGNVQIGYNKHFLNTPNVIFQPDKKGEFRMQGVDINCEGLSVALAIEDRLTDDCVENLKARIIRLEMPDKSLFMEVVRALPEVPAEEDIPAWDFDLLIDKGDFKLDFRVKYVITAGVYAWGHVQFENDRKVLAVRLDRVKYGYLGVTHLVFKKLRELNRPDIIVEEPWIRVRLGGKK